MQLSKLCRNISDSQQASHNKHQAKKCLDRDCKMRATRYYSELIIVFEEHQSHYTLRCFWSINGGGFDFFMTSAIGKFICTLKQLVFTQKVMLLLLKFVAYIFCLIEENTIQFYSIKRIRQ